MENTKKTHSVALLLPELVEGGVERHVVELAKGLDGLGLTIFVVSAGGPMTKELPDGVRHIEMPVDRKSFLTALPCAKKLAAFIVNEGIEIIHTHSRVPAWIALFAKKLTGVKFIFTAHARYSLNYGLLPLRYADGVVCVSDSVREYLEQWLPSNAPIRVVYNAVPKDILPWTGSGVSRRHFLYLGRLTPKKGPLTLIEALARITPHGWCFDIVGDGPMRGELEKKTAELGLEKQITFHGHRSDTARWIKECDLFLFPSHEEGLPLALIEALCAGAPILASDIPAVRELTVANERDTRELLPVADADAWSDAIGNYLNGEFVPSLSLKARLPNEAEMAQQTADFYSEIIGTQNT